MVPMTQDYRNDRRFRVEDPWLRPRVTRR
jgi:hypothetical protein